MANFDWNEIIVTNDGNVANEQVKERMILVTGEKGDNGKDGRGILKIRKSGVSGKYVTFTIEYDDGTRSNFTLELPSGQGGDIDTTIIAEEFDSANRYYEGYYVTYNGKLYQFIEDHLVGEWNPDQVRQLFVMNDVYYKANYRSITKGFISSKTYHVGDFVMYNGDLYKFVSEHQRNTPWDLDEVELCTVLELLPDDNAIAPEFDENYLYANGDYVMYNGGLYKCIWGHQGAWNPDDFEKVSVIDLINNYFVNIVARQFRYNSDYDEDDYVVNNYRMLCRFIVPYQNGESFIDKVAFVTVTDEMKRLFESAESKIAPMFSESTDYAVGDLVRVRSDVYPHNILLCKFITDHPAGEWDGRHVIGTTVERLLKERLNSDVIASEFSTNKSYSIGNYVMYDGRLYIFIADHPAGEWDEYDVSIVHLADDFIDNRRLELRIKNKANSTSIAPEFSENDSYAVGDYVMHNGSFYKFISAHTAGAWNDRHVTIAEVIDEFVTDTDLSTALSAKTDLSIIAPEFNEIFSYNIGRRVIYDGVLYEFIAPHEGAWDSSHVNRIVLDNVLSADENKIKQKASYFAVASPFNTLFFYSAGDYVYYGDYLYKFTSEHQGEWDSTHVTTIALADEVKNLDLNKTSLSNIADDFSNSEAYNVGDCVIHNGNLYRFITTHSAGTWNSNHVEQVNIIEVINENGKAIWGEITGDITDQTDLMELLTTGEIGNMIAYVNASTGADTNDGSYDHPYATIQKAVDEALITGTSEIRIQAGTYSEEVLIENKNVDIQILGNVIWNTPQSKCLHTINANVRINANQYILTLNGCVWIYNDSYCLISGDNITISPNLTVLGSSAVVIDSSIFISDTSNNSVLTITNPNISTTTGNFTGIHAYNSSRVYLDNIEINSSVGIECESGSIVAYRTLTGNAPFGNQTRTGGRIFTDEQVPEPPYNNKIYGRKNGYWIEIPNVESKTFYVDCTNGSDDNDGSLSHPFASIHKALSEGGTGIYIYGGNYPRTQELYLGGTVTFYLLGDVTLNHTIYITAGRIRFVGRSNVGTSSAERNLTITTNYRSFEIESNSSVYFDNVNVSTPAEIRIRNSNLFTDKNFTISVTGNYDRCLDISENSNVYIGTLNLTGYEGFWVAEGSVLSYGTLIENVTQSDQVYNGGRVHTGVYKYIGDAPSNNKSYGRRNGEWYALESNYYSKTETDDLLSDKVSTDDFETQVERCDDIEEELAKKEDIIINDATGSPATLESEIAVNLTKCIADIDFTQETDGYDPSVKNLIPPFTNQTQENGTLTVDADGNCTVNKPEKSTVVHFTYQNTITLQPNTLYRLSFNNESGKNNIHLYLTENADPSASVLPIVDVSGSSPNMSKTFSLSGYATTAKTVYLHISVQTNIFTNYKFSPMLECVQLSQNLLPNFQTETVSETQLTVSDNGTCTLQGTSTAVANFTAKSIELDPGMYEIHFDRDASDNRSVMRFEVSLSSTFDTTVKTIGYPYTIDTLTVSSKNTYYFRIVKVDGAHVQTAFTFTPLLKLVGEPSPYSPYNHICPIVGRTGLTVTANGTDHAISWQSQAGTVYKGSLDVLTGTLTVTYGEIASYNGQTLTGMWYSDRDVYAEGITPTTGAQVIYQLATPLTYQLTPTEIQTIVGSNSFSADSGEVFVQYFTDQKLQSYIDEHDEELRSETKTALDNKADVITASASGNPVAITDGSPAPVVDLTVGIEPVQDLHGVDYPYPAGGGKNLWNPEWVLNRSIGSNADIVGGNSEAVMAYIPCQVGMTYTVSKSGGSRFACGFTTELPENGVSVLNAIRDNSASSLTNTAPIEAVYFIAYLDLASSGSTRVDLNTVQIELGSVPTSYEPYSNICPISGWTGAKITRIGKNYLETVPVVVEKHGVTVVVNDDGMVTLNGTSDTAQVIIFNLADSSAGNSRQCDNKKHLPNGIYRKTPAGANVGWYLQIIGTNTENAGSTDSLATISGASANVFTIDDTYKYNYMRLYIYKNASFDNETIYPWVYKTDEVTEYPITFPSEAETVYGGNLDVTTGVLTVDRKLVELDEDDNWTFQGGGARAVLDDAWTDYDTADSPTSVSQRVRCICNRGRFTVSSQVEGVCFIGKGSGKFYYYPPVTITNLEEFLTWVAENPLQVSYKLATPITYQLTLTEVTTLLGENTISADTGAIDVTYRADTKTYIDQKIAESQRATRSLIAGIETEMIATKNYSVGDLLIVGDTLYKVTSNIAITGEITVGTNVTATTVAEQLILLANA